MGLKKGQSGNLNGRPKGTPNKVTASLREKLKLVLDSEIENLPELLKDLEPDKRLKAFVDLLQYALPKATEPFENDFKITPGSFLELVKRQYNDKINSPSENINPFDNNKLREIS
jgi:hypothetical protein